MGWRWNVSLNIIRNEAERSGVDCSTCEVLTLGQHQKAERHNHLKTCGVCVGLIGPGGYIRLLMKKGRYGS